MGVDHRHIGIEHGRRFIPRLYTADGIEHPYILKVDAGSVF